MPGSLPQPRPAYVYIYYALAAPPGDARERLAALFTDLESTTGIAGRLLQRCDDAQTWMEVYGPVRDLAAFRTALNACVLRHDVGSLARDGARHVECFAPVPYDAAG